MKGLARTFGWVRYHRWYVAGFVALILSFNLNIFGLGHINNWFDSFERFSESIVYKTMECEGAVEGYGGLITTKDRENFNKHMYNPGCGEPVYKPYVSQYGLQGRVFVALKPSGISEGLYIKAVEVLLTILMALAIMLLIRQFVREFGITAATATYVLLLLSPWIAGYARNLYWVAFTLILPFLISFTLYEKLKKAKRLPIFYSLLFGVFLLKFLNGYEFASTILISAFIPIVYFELKDKHISILSLWKPAIVVLLAGCLALAVAITANAAGLRAYTQSWGEAFGLVAGRAEDRSNLNTYKKFVVHGLKRQTPAAHAMTERFYNVDQLRDGGGSTLKYILISGISYMMLPAITLPFVLHEPLGTIVQSLLMAIIISSICLWQLRRQAKAKQLKKIRAISWCFWLGLAGGFSWLLLMPGHAFVHAHINAIVFYIPFLFFAYVAMGLYLESLLSKGKPSKLVCKNEQGISR